MANKWFSFFFWHLVMNDDGVMWKMVNTPRKKRMFVRWWGDVQESLKRSSYNTKCTIFYPSSIYTAIQNVQNVEYSTIPKYTKYTEYTKYTKYTTYSTIVFYIHCNIYIFHDFCSLVEQNLASALWKAGFRPVHFFCTANIGNLDKQNLASARTCHVGFK